MSLRILLLGGTGEARHLAAALAARPATAVVLSYAGRTGIAPGQPVPIRVGGFGGVEGLCAHLRAERVSAVIDATHPFAATMSRHAALACGHERVPLARLVRPAWTRREGDRWRSVGDFAAAAASLGREPKRVFLTIGQGGLDAFACAPHHAYLVRAIGAPPSLPAPNARLLLDRPPYTAAAEEQLLREERVDILVAKNSGGAATAGKLDAARRLGLDVVMIERPALPAGVPEFGTPAEILGWLGGLQAERGV